jgi:hypothetical protein
MEDGHQKGSYSEQQNATTTGRTTRDQKRLCVHCLTFAYTWLHSLGAAPDASDIEGLRVNVTLPSAYIEQTGPTRFYALPASWPVEKNLANMRDNFLGNHILAILFRTSGVGKNMAGKNMNLTGTICSLSQTTL